MILHGPPGSGKTTLARIIATTTGAAFEEHSAVDAGRAEVRAVIERARHRGGATVFFLDEIHRFNKAQQDALLPAVEEGLVTLIGATTENPRFEVNSALLSRLTVYDARAADRGRDRHPAHARPRARRDRRGRARRRRRRAAGAARRRRCADRARRARARRRDRRADRSRGGARRAGRRAGPLRPRRATSTTTRSRPGSRRPAAATPTPRCTTLRRCSRAARTHASSPGGW